MILIFTGWHGQLPILPQQRDGLPGPQPDGSLRAGRCDLRIGGVAPDIWLYGWNQNTTSTVTGMYNAEPHS